MRRRILAALSAFFLAISALGGCGDDYDEYDKYDDDDRENWGAQSKQDSSESREDKTTEGKQTSEEPAGTDESLITQGLVMSVDSSTGRLNITRRQETGTKSEQYEEGWTILVYLCGTDLETEYGMGSDDMGEMLQAMKSDRVRFVVETGGTEEWSDDEISCDHIQRFLIQNGEMQKVDEQPAAGMGRAGTLSDFLLWGTKEYASKHMGLVMWDHGGGSITGVCFDELDEFDSLDLMELDEANSRLTGKI